MGKREKLADIEFGNIDERLLDLLEHEIGYHFKKKELLIQSLTHSSYSNERGGQIENNERLEFLGDAALELAVSDIMYQQYPRYTEGELSKLRSLIVNERQLSKLADELRLGDLILLGRGEELTGGRKKPSVLADAFEALLAAVYLDGGYEKLKKVVSRIFRNRFFASKSPLEDLNRDFKTQLQEYSQNEFKATPVYHLEKETGPDHDKTFFVSVSIKDEKIGYGEGKTKKAAEQRAAEEALNILWKKKKTQEKKNRS